MWTRDLGAVPIMRNRCRIAARIRSSERETAAGYDLDVAFLEMAGLR